MCSDQNGSKTNSHPVHADPVDQWSITENLLDALIVMDRNGVMVYCNKALLDFFSYAREELIGRHCSMLFRSEHESSRLNTIASTVVDDNTSAKVELICLKRGSVEITMEARLSPWRGTDGTGFGIVVMLREVSEGQRTKLETKQNGVCFRELFENMSIGVAIYEPAYDGQDFILKDLNQASQKIKQISGQQVIGRKVTEIFPRVDECGLLEVLRKVAEDGLPRKHPATMCREDLSMGCRDVYVYSLSSGKIVVVYEDVTRQTKAEIALAESESRLRAIMESIQAGIVIIDPADHLIVEANPMALKMIGAERDKVVGEICHRFICPAELGKCPITDLGQNVDNSERLLLNIKGELSPVLKTVAKVTLQGREHLLESFLDISQLKELENKLREMANIDSLTGAFSRAYFMDLFTRELSCALRYEKPLSLVLFDIDHFKKVNDLYGHQAGDLVLKGLCQLCKDKLRDTDILGRIGGEEFAILSIESDLAGATMAAERLRLEIMDSAWDYEGTSIRCTVSFGVAQFYGPGDSLSMLFKRADEALYRAKNLGRNMVCQPAL